MRDSTFPTTEHIRGRVYPRRYPAKRTISPAPYVRYCVEVVNTATGVVINSDSGYGTLGEAMDDCAARVHYARAAAWYPLRTRDLKRRKAAR